tara:strand:- start:10865 stop:11071 length:207 start_codon:yes stop_codon:yes gene_type:complete
MSKFIFSNTEKLPRPDKSIIFKNSEGKTHEILEVDYSKVADYLNIPENEAMEICKAVGWSIWRLKSYH